ncbi:DUF2752 domain-containing protein [Xanthomonas citri]|uniref:DUF2752 domain-containing protein n=1 Tax=Xanthomonas citri TaxID=346 RepID=UPI000247D284|nr:DUF2752 domain-containing protein [Xanthomonas citri]MBE0317387.1 DUF2752 domain-containing protein [Xanthomonas citri pv. punicae]MDS0759966.1 DUF2752 domain-containing protein [Xanthomonas citri pv. punicae]MDS0763743.1 DUF2752 domain-containing protein [Xanthomonas citri pv. punicae]MDS0798514.1 DUF2752 domain-containing protein [Xanthomonas citri pv. punicae]MDS0831142.1 DUF2752 domain-containing protein [Xanthomonas citri pv. punicae]
MELRPRHWLGLGAATSVAALGVSLLYRFDPNASNSPFPPCVFRAVTGCYCPGCGMTRALYALVHFDLPGAFAMNPAAVLGLFILPGLIAWKAGWRARWFSPVVAVMSEPKFWLWVLPTYWIARNLPWYPFTLLAPG